MKRRTKALQINERVRAIVSLRDSGLCVLCGKQGLPNAHYISRGQGGLGIEQNIVTLCNECHYKLDHTIERKKLLVKVRKYLDFWYPNFSERTYKK